MVDANLAVVGYDASAVPVLERIGVDAAADWSAGEDLLRNECEAGGPRRRALRGRSGTFMMASSVLTGPNCST